MERFRDALSGRADICILCKAQLIMDVNCRDGAFRSGDNHLIQTADHIARRVQTANRCILMVIDLQRPMLITACQERARQVVLRPAA
jgi:hypothetical protein